MVIFSSRLFMPFQASGGCFCVVVACLLCLLMVLYGVGCFWAVLDISVSFFSDLWLGLSNST